MKTLQERATDAMAMLHDVPSPCISHCSMRESDGLCEGCFRTLAEIVLGRKWTTRKSASLEGTGATQSLIAITEATHETHYFLLDFISPYAWLAFQKLPRRCKV